MPTLTRDEQKILTQQLTDGIARYIITRIENGKIPESWDGHELRLLVLDIAKENVTFGNPSRKMLKAYKNTRIVEGF